MNSFQFRFRFKEINYYHVRSLNIGRETLLSFLTFLFSLSYLKQNEKNKKDFLCNSKFLQSQIQNLI